MQFAGNFEKGIQGSRRKDLVKYSSTSACLNVSLLALIEKLFTDILINRLFAEGAIHVLLFVTLKKKKKK